MWDNILQFVRGANMKKIVISALVLLTCLMVLSPRMAAQEKPKTEEGTKTEIRPTPLKVQVVFSEFEADKKVKSMPYTSIVTADAGRGQDYSKLRIGSRVPLYTGKENGLQYIDVGTNLDFRAERLEDGKFGLKIALERSWVQGDVEIPVNKTVGSQIAPSPGQFKEPVIGQYKTDVYLVVRDGQTVENTVATDPLSGRLLKIELTLSVAK
jgi:hypothetical protein